MKYFPHILIICFIILVGLIIYKNNKQGTPNQEYTLDVHIDTIYDYVIVTTVVNNGNNIGVNSIMVDDIYGFTKTKQN